MTKTEARNPSKHSGAFGEHALPASGLARPSLSSVECYTSHVNAAEIINKLPKLNETERRAILEKLRELSHQDDEQWERIIADPHRARNWRLS